MKTHFAVLAVTLLVLAAGCRGSSTKGFEPTPGGPVLTIEFSGGLCLYGLCSRTVVVDLDGSFEDIDGAGTRHAGAVDAVLAAAVLREAARADWPSIRSVAFEDVCPTAYDGQELTYSFHLGDGALERVSSCQFALDASSEPFASVQRLLDAIAR